MLVSFNSLWSRHPSNLGNDAPCSTNGKSNFDNQCAIRMGVCLFSAGISLSSFRGDRCYPGHKHNQSHILRVLDLVEWFKIMPQTFGKAIEDKNPTSAKYKGRQGIVYFENFWGNNNQGDHIDLWDGSLVAKGDASFFDRSERILFWELP